MTRKEINSQINKVPAERRLHLGIELLEELPDSCVILTHNRIEYRSYPEIPGILVGSKFVTWETGSEDVCEVDVKNPEHMEEIIRRGSRLQFDNIVGIAGKDKDGKLTLELEPVEFVDKEFAGVVPVDGTVIYYDPNIIRMTKNRRTDLLAMFLSKRYRREYMIPFRDEPPVEWGAYE